MRRAIVWFALVAPVILLLLWPHKPLAGIGVLAISHALLLYPTLRPNVQWLGPVITHFTPSTADAREVWLTIDDGPTEDTHAVLDLLDARNVKATFFLIGMLADAHPELVRAIAERGHTIGNHSQSHPSGTFWCLPPAAVATEVDACSRALESATRMRPRWFRAPVGMKNPGVHPILEKRGMRLIGWSIRSFDGVETTPERVLARILPRVTSGSILVLHQGRAGTLAIVARVIDELHTRGYSFVIPADDRLKTKR